MASAKHARYVRAQLPETEISIYYIDRRASGRQESFLAETERDAKTHFVPGKVSRVSVEDGKLVLDVEDMGRGRRIRQSVDLLVLATGVVPSETAVSLDRDGYGFLTASPGQLPAGCAREPMDVASAVRDATGAVLRALAHCPARGG